MLLPSRGFRGLMFALLLSLGASIPGEAADGGEVDEAVAAHTAAWKKIESFAFTFETSFSVTEAGTVRQSSERSGQRWASQGGRDRYHFLDRIRRGDVEDILVTETDLLRIARPPERRIQDLSPGKPPSLRGERKLGRNDPYRSQLPCLLRAFEFHEDAARQTVETIAATWKRIDNRSDEAATATTRTWRFRRGEPGPWRDNEVALTFDSAVGGLCRTMRDEFTAPALDGSGPVRLVRVITAREFREVGGVWFPVDIESVTSCGPDAEIRCRWTLGDLQVNTLSAAETELRIPERTVVATFREDGTQGEIVLYGQGQRPLRTFATPEEYDEFRLAEDDLAKGEAKLEKSPRRTGGPAASPAR